MAGSFYFQGKFSQKTHAFTSAGWITVKRELKIAHNLETTALKIKTDSAVGSGEKMDVILYNSDGGYVGHVYFILSSPPQFLIGACISALTTLRSTLPREIHKVWQLTKLPGPRIVLQCNGVIVLDITMSKNTCDSSDWTQWSQEVKQISFTNFFDTASDSYKSAAPPGDLLFNFSKRFLIQLCTGNNGMFQS